MSRIKTTTLADGYCLPRLINGGWQLSAGHQLKAEQANTVTEHLSRLASAGLTAFDCADIYTGVEEQFGRFRAEYARKNGREAAAVLRFHTKSVPDASHLAALRRETLRATVERSLTRLGVDRLDLVQFHWWDYNVPGYVEAADWLDELRREGKIHRLGVTNFDVARLREMVEAGVTFVSHQVQYSLLDRRPRNGMTEFCRDHGIGLLCYGSLAGGFLSDTYLGRDEEVSLRNRSLVKYRLIVDEFGGWQAFQNLLHVLRKIADKHGASIANVAVAWLLDQPGVSAAIIGAPNAKRLDDNLRVFEIALDEIDHQAIEACLSKASGPEGDTFELERIRGGPHAVIMKTNLNQAE